MGILAYYITTRVELFRTLQEKSGVGHSRAQGKSYYDKKLGVLFCILGTGSLFEISLSKGDLGNLRHTGRETSMLLKNRQKTTPCMQSTLRQDTNVTVFHRYFLQLVNDLPVEPPLQKTDKVPGKQTKPRLRQSRDKEMTSDEEIHTSAPTSENDSQEGSHCVTVMMMMGLWSWGKTVFSQPNSRHHQSG